MAVPSYLELARTGELERRASVLKEILEDCTLCPQECRVNRAAGEEGDCGASAEPVVSSCFPHYGEEPPLVGWRGSGTVFFTHCSMKCVFCQNYSISHLGEGAPVSSADLASAMLQLQRIGCHNINFVTPTHYAPQIVGAVAIAAEQGLQVPLVYNSSGYDAVETLRLLDGIIDIYMPDTKFVDNDTAAAYSQAQAYADAVFPALKEMHRQVGDLRINGRGVAERGLLIRHLVMPGGLAGTDEMMRFIAEELSTDSYVNIMDQYRPAYRAAEFPKLKRRITIDEYYGAVNAAEKAGLHRGFR